MPNPSTFSDIASVQWDYNRKAVVTSSVTTPFAMFDQEDVEPADLQRSFQLVPWMFRGIEMRANAVAKMPFRITKNGSKDKEPFESSSSYENKLGFLPNPARLFWRVEAASSIWGSAYAWRSRNTVKTLGLRYIIPSTITPEIDDEKGLVGFTRYVSGQPRAASLKDVVYFWRPDPFVEIGPPLSSPAKAALAAAGVLLNVDLFAAAFFQRGAIKATLLTVDGNPPKTEREALKTWWARIIGGIKNAFATEVISASVKPIQIGEGINDLANTTLTEEKKSEVAVALGVPQSVIFSGSATGLGGGGVAEQDDKHFYDKTVVPECEWLADDLNEQVLTPMGYTLSFMPETLDVFKDDEVAVAGAFKVFVDTGLKKSLSAQLVGLELPVGWTYDMLDEEPKQPEQPASTGGKPPTDAVSPEDDEAEPDKPEPGDEESDATKVGNSRSGYHGHAGVPGRRGGSAPAGTVRVLAAYDYSRQERTGQQSGPLRQQGSGSDAAIALKSFNLTPAELQKMVTLRGYNAEVTISKSSAHGEEYIEVKTNYFTKSGQTVGRQTFSLTKKDGEISANADYMKFTQEFQGKNLAESLMGRQVDMALRKKYSEVSTLADISIGKYAWAKKGFQYKSSSAADQATRKFKEWCKNKAIRLNEYPTFRNPQDVVNFKVPGVTLHSSRFWNSDAKPGDYDLGKAFMLDDDGHGNWHATMDLRPFHGFYD